LSICSSINFSSSSAISLEPNQKVIQVQLVTLRPKNGIRMKLIAR
jgi:hypothetical protein